MTTTCPAIFLGGINLQFCFDATAGNSRSHAVIIVEDLKIKNMVAPIKTGERYWMKVPYDEGIAYHIGPESCVGARKDVGEALTALVVLVCGAVKRAPK